MVILVLLNIFYLLFLCAVSQVVAKLGFASVFVCLFFPVLK